MEKDTTKKRNYSFTSPYQGVDFKKIVEKNSDADFIEVRWKTEDGLSDGIVIVNNFGIKRLYNACIPLETDTITNDSLVLTPSGRVVIGQGCVKMSFIHISRWKDIYELLVKRENGSYEFEVCAIL